MKKCLILANGKAPAKSALTYFLKGKYKTFYCADGGADSALTLNLTPDYIIGDLDSISIKALRYFSKKSEIIRIERQNDTDVEKCIKHAVKNKFEEAILTGVTGNRLDHTFCNLGIVLKFFEKIRLHILAEKSLLTPYRGNIEIDSVEGETISLYAFDKKTKITSAGLHYPLKNDILPFGEKESTSNIATGNKIKLKITNGIIFVIRDFSLMKKHGFI